MAETIIWDLQIGENDVTKIASSAFGECTTEATSSNKAVSLAGFTQAVAGVTVHVKFTNTNTSPNPTLQIGTSTPHTIKTYGSESNNDVPTWPAGAVVAFTFDGTNWIMNSGLNTDTTYNVQNTYNSSSTDPISGQGVAAAIGGLDLQTAISNTAGKTVATITEQDGIVGATFQDISIKESQVVNDTDSTRTLIDDLAAKAPTASPTFTGVVTLPAMGNESSNLTAATKAYVDSRTAGLTNAIHYIGDATVTISEQGQISVSGLPENYVVQAGDVVGDGSYKEYLYTGSGWRELGDEHSYALKEKTADVIQTVSINHSRPSLTRTNEFTIPNVTSAGTLPSLSTTPVTVRGITTAGTAATFQVQDGTLKITPGTNTVADTNETSFNAVGTFSEGTLPSFGTAFVGRMVTDWNDGGDATLTTTQKTVVIP